MKIKKIELYNFGSYEGTNIFDLTSDDPNRRIVVIGGKNGSGKTTFFTAIQLCLYGNFAFGYKGIGSRYLKKVKDFINNNARLKEDETTYITVEFEHTDARDRAEYKVTRKWIWPTGKIEELLYSFKDGKKMDEDELIDFQNYLVHLIPPDMLKLYFFDGEKIADYFLSDSKINIREALMVLSGNDTFDIIQNNVRRVLKLNKNWDTLSAKRYMDIQEECAKKRTELDGFRAEMNSLNMVLESTESTLHQAKTLYAAQGGLTMKQWEDLQGALKSEENRREHIYQQRRTDATDSLPFVIMRDLTDKISPQIAREDDYASFCAMRSKLSEDSFRKTLVSVLNDAGIDSEETVDKALARITGSLLSEDLEGFMPLFQLSNDEKMQVHSVLGRVNDYDPGGMKKYQDWLDASLRKTKDIREKLQKSNIEHIEAHIKETTYLEENINQLKKEIEQKKADIERATEELNTKEKTLIANHKEFENTLKKESVAALSGRVLLLLEDLQSEIYTGLIKKVETNLKIKLGQLIRKNDFFDDISIDSDFNVHIIKNQEVSVTDLIKIVCKGGITALKNSIGELAVNQLCPSGEGVGILVSRLKSAPSEMVCLPVEINKVSMSSGEKQIFVMSLYWAIMQQSKNDLPFTIDTPFARIDKEHRVNITRHFFSSLTGQLFILSTDEELEQEHLDAMKDEIAHVYMLEYGEDKRTKVHKDTYLEVEHGF